MCSAAGRAGSSPQLTHRSGAAPRPRGLITRPSINIFRIPQLRRLCEMPLCSAPTTLQIFPFTLMKTQPKRSVDRESKCQHIPCTSCCLDARAEGGGELEGDGMWGTQRASQSILNKLKFIISTLCAIHDRNGNCSELVSRTFNSEQVAAVDMTPIATTYKFFHLTWTSCAQWQRCQHTYTPHTRHKAHRTVWTAHSLTLSRRVANVDAYWTWNQTFLIFKAPGPGLWLH